MNIVNIPITDIDDSPDLNCRSGRIEPISVNGLAEDIAMNGLHQPVTVIKYPEKDAIRRGYKYRLIMGFRRTLAHKVLQRDTIPAIIKEGDFDEAALRVMNLSENLQRRELTILEEARALKVLLDLGVTQDDAADRLNTSRGWVQVRYMLLKLPENVQEMVVAYRFSQAEIRKLHTIIKHASDPEEGLKLTLHAAKELRDAKAEGRPAKVKQFERKANSKRLRSKKEIQDMIMHLAGIFGYGLFTRLLAWASGEVSDEEIFIDIEQFADSCGLKYQRPLW